LLDWTLYLGSKLFTADFFIQDSGRLRCVLIQSQSSREMLIDAVSLENSYFLDRSWEC